MTAEAARKAPGQWRSVRCRAVHPRQALAFAVVVGAAGRADRSAGARGRWSARATVLVAQLIMGLVNDLLDVDRDRMGGAKNKPIAEGIIPPGNASFAIAVLLLLAIPLSLQNGIEAGVYVLATLVVGYVHNRWLHTTPLSWVGWSAHVRAADLLRHLRRLGPRRRRLGAADHVRGAVRRCWASACTS